MNFNLDERKAKIIATIGPATETPETIRELLVNGVDVIRLNFSHGSFDEHKNRIDIIRAISKEINRSVSIIQDLQGPKLRLGVLPDSGFVLQQGERICLSSHDPFFAGTKDQSACLPLDIPDVEKFVEVNDRILLDDGYFELKAIEISESGIIAKVISGGKVSSNKGVNLPDSDINIPTFTEKDKKDLVFGLNNDIDILALSFIKSADDIQIVRKFIDENVPERSGIPIIAKIERPIAMKNLDEIINEADGVMIARGDLAVETSPYFVPIAQKKIIDMANQKSKIVITATQMLESMIEHPRPTRAEASDVANAILDGSDAVMLSGETAIGKYPIKTIQMMHAIILEAEKNYESWGHHTNTRFTKLHSDSLSMAQAAYTISDALDVASIAVFTQSGRTAILMSKMRPSCPIIAFTPHQNTYQRLNLIWGIIPVQIPFANTAEKMVSEVEKAMLTFTKLEIGQQIVLVSTFPIGRTGKPNFVLLHTIGNPI
ncbi:MAG: pyruvate kinase [Anaerolineaceae bacterium]|nr:pyruvate kinase [Anaerolineaceae bacterium]